MRAILLVLLFCICASPALAEPLRVALLLEHDGASAYYDLLKKGLKEAEGPEVRADIIIIPEGPGQREQFRQAAASHDLVLVATDSLHEALRDNAANYRRVMFGSIDAGIRAPNIMSVTFADEQAAFLAGAYAAMLAGKEKDPVIGWLSGRDTPAMRSLFNGYSEGALLARPGGRIIQAVVGSFQDPALAASKTEWLIASGAKVLALAAGAGNQAALAVAKARDVPVIELDSPSGAPAAGVIAKAVDRAVREIVASAASGKFRRKEIITYNLANQGVDFIFNPATASRDAGIARRMGELRKEIEKGNIRLRSLRQRTLCDCLD